MKLFTKREEAYRAAKRFFLQRKDVRSRMCKEWLEYNDKNPDVYDKLCELLREMKNAGYDQWSIQGAFEVARWQCRMDIERTKKFAFPNEFGAYYARIIMIENPDLYKFMRVSKSEADHELGWTHFKMIMDREEEVFV